MIAFPEGDQSAGQHPKISAWDSHIVHEDDPGVVSAFGIEFYQEVGDGFLVVGDECDNSARAEARRLLGLTKCREAVLSCVFYGLAPMPCYPRAINSSSGTVFQRLGAS